LVNQQTEAFGGLTRLAVFHLEQAVGMIQGGLFPGGRIGDPKDRFVQGELGRFLGQSQRGRGRQDQDQRGQIQTQSPAWQDPGRLAGPRGPA
jgi:hypothetical protein